MRTKTMGLGLVLAVAGMMCFIAQPAWADHHGGKPFGGLGKALSGGHHGKGGLPNFSRAIRGGGKGHSPNLGNLIGQGLRNGSAGHGRSQNLGGLLGQGLRNGRGGHGGSQNLGGLLGQGLRNGRSGYGGSQNLGGLLGQGYRNGNIGHGEILQSLIGQGGYGGYGGGNYRGGYGGYGGYGQGYGYGYDEYGMPQAYRDVGIANAVVGLVGIAAQAAQNSQYYQYAQPAAPYYRERVVTAPARYETTQVWVPESFDPRTGAKIGGGFYENRTQLVPEVVEERMVPAPVAVPYGTMAPPLPPVITTYGGR